MWKECFSKGCKHIKLTRSKCREAISNLLALHFERELKNDIAKKKFSLIIDASNDISVAKLLGFAIGYFSDSNKSFVTTFLDLVELREYSANAICNDLKKGQESHRLELQKLIAIGTDNA